MTANLQQETNQILELKKRVTQLDNLIQGYRLCARTEGKSDKTIQITITALTTLRDFLDSRGYSTDVNEISTHELREFILHLQQVKAFSALFFIWERKRERRITIPVMVALIVGVVFAVLAVFIS